MAETPAADSIDAGPGRRETTTNIKSLIRTFEHSSSAERVAGTTSVVADDPNVRQTSKSMISSETAPKDSATNAATNSSVQKIVQSFSSMATSQQTPEQASTYAPFLPASFSSPNQSRRVDQPMVRQKSFTFGTKNAIVRRPPPPIPASKSPSSVQGGGVARADSANAALSQSMEQPRPVSPTKNVGVARQPVSRSTSVAKAPLFGAAARAFSPINSPTGPNPAANKRMTTQLSSSTLSDEFQQMKDSVMNESGSIPHITSKRPPPAPPGRSPSMSAIASAETTPAETPAEVQVATPAANEPTPEAVQAKDETKPEEAVAEPAKPAEVPVVAAVPETVEVAPTPSTEVKSEEPAPAVAVPEPAADEKKPVAEVSAPADDDVTVRENSSSESKVSDSAEPSVAPQSESVTAPAVDSVPASPSKDKKKRRDKEKKHVVEEEPEPVVAEKKDKDKKKKRSKHSESAQPTEEAAEAPEEPSPVRTKRSKSQKLPKMLLNEAAEKDPEGPAPAVPELKHKKSKRTKKSVEVDSTPSTPSAPSTPSTPVADSPTGKKQRVKSQRLSIDPKLIVDGELAAASPAADGSVSERKSKRSKKVDAPSSPRSKISHTPSTSESAEGRTLKKAQSTASDSTEHRSLKRAQSNADSTEERKIKKVSSQAEDSTPSKKKPAAEPSTPVEPVPEQPDETPEKPVASESSLNLNLDAVNDKEDTGPKKKKSARLSVMLKLPDEPTPASPGDSSPSKKGISNRKKRQDRRRVVRSLTSPLGEDDVEDANRDLSNSEDSDVEPVMPLSARDSNRTGVNQTSDTDSEVDAIKERLAPRRARSRSERRGGRPLPQISSSSSDSDSDSDGPIRRPSPDDEPPTRSILSHAHVVDDTDLTTDFEPDGRIHVVIKRRARPFGAAGGPVSSAPASALPVTITASPSLNPRVAGSESETAGTPQPVRDVVEEDDDMEIDNDMGVATVSVESARKKKRRGSAKPVPLANRNSMAKVTIAAGLSDVNFWAEPPTSAKNAIFEDQGKMFAYNQGKEMARKGGQGLAIKAASFNKLVEHLTWPDYNEDDKIFQRIFLSTLDYFTTPSHLLKKLAQRFDVPTPKKGGDSSFEATVKAPIQQRVCSVIKFWLEHFSSEFSDTFVQQMKDFMSSQLSGQENKRIYDILTNALNDLIARQTQIQERLRPPSVEKKSTSKRDLMRKTQSESTLMFFPTQKVCHPIELVQNDEAARQITAVDWKIWSAIRPWEILKAVLNDNTYNASSSPLKELVARFNQISNFVISAILAQKTVKERARLVSKFIKIAKELRALNNYNSLMAISAGINHTCVARLSQTMAAVPRKDLKTLNRLDRLMSVKKNWKRYRDALAEATGPCIPYLGLIVADFVFVHEGHPDEISGLINFSKMKFLYFNCIELMQTHQSQQYFLETQNLQVDGMVYTQQILEPNQIYKRSITLEPVKKGNVPEIQKETFTPIISQPVRNSSKEIGKESAPSSPAPGSGKGKGKE